VPLELGMLFAGFALFMTMTRPRGTAGTIVPWAVLAILVGVQGFNWFTPPTSDQTEFTVMGLGVYFAMAGLAWVLDRVRLSPTAHQSGVYQTA
jgi:hypothetical protein